MTKGRIYKYAIVLMLITSIISCSKKEDTPTSPGNDARDNLVGSWTCDETSKLSGKASYSVNISKDVASNDGIIIKNFYQLGSSTNTLGSLDGTYITIPQQSVSGYTVKGSGTYNSNTTINFTFTTNDGQKTDSVTAVCHH